VASIKIGIVMLARGMHSMTQTSVTALEKSLSYAGLLNSSNLVLVDNSSPDPYQPDHLDTNVSKTIVRLDKSHSFSAASNWGAAKLRDSDMLLFLNNDVFLHPRAVEAMIQDKVRLSAEVCGPRLVYPNGKIQHVGVGFTPGMAIPHHLHHYEPSSLHPRVSGFCQAISGAAMLIDSELFWELKGFDEIFSFCYEDTDFCLRAAAIGKKIICSQTVDSIHLEGQTRNETSMRYQNLSAETFAARWGGRISSLSA
jgi:GT2 family glycosyltransferase